MEKGATWNKLHEKYPNHYLFLNNIIEDDSECGISSADLVDYCTPGKIDKFMSEHTNDYQRIVFTGHALRLSAIV